MDSGTFVTLYFPIFILFVLLHQQHAFQLILAAKRIRHRRKVAMTNELLQQYTGKQCKISSGSYGSTVKGKIIQVNENWIEVETASGLQIVNAEFVQIIKVLN
jgi:hypothetical protein